MYPTVHTSPHGTSVSRRKNTLACAVCPAATPSAGICVATAATACPSCSNTGACWTALVTGSTGTPAASVVASTAAAYRPG